MGGSGIGLSSITRLIEDKSNNLSKNLLSILELLLDQNDTRFISARSQILDIIGNFKRGVIEDIKNNYDINSLRQETIIVGNK